jgi:hypothetical protein
VEGPIDKHLIFVRWFLESGFTAAEVLETTEHVKYESKRQRYRDRQRQSHISLT